MYYIHFEVQNKDAKDHKDQKETKLFKFQLKTNVL